MSWPTATWPAQAAGAAVPVSATTAQALAAARLVYVKGDGTIDYADATAEGKEAVGFTTEAFGAGVTGEYYTTGQMTGLSSLTPGVRYFMTATPGVVGAIPSTTGNVVLCVGTAASATVLNFNLETPVTL